jgi:hypothetical protein
VAIQAPLPISATFIFPKLFVMRKIHLYLLLPAFIFFTASYSQVSLTGVTYTQDFNTLASSGTSGALPAGWAFSESGTNANLLYNTGTGSGNAGDTYSFGAAGNTDRAFGGLQSGSLNPTIGVSFINNTGGTVTSLNIVYTGEQWRLGALARTDRIDFQYSLNATSLTTGSWIDVNNLDFAGPATTGTVGSLNGNATANRTTISFTITGLFVPNGSVFFIRWNDFNATGADDGLAIDDFSITPGGTGALNLTINDISLSEGNAGTTPFIFTVSLSTPAAAGGVSFDITTQDNTAIAPGDYAIKTLTSQTIPEGSSTYSFTVLVNGDLDPESNENFFVNITNIVGANSGDAQGVGTIINDDCGQTHTIAQIQGNGNTSPLTGNIITTSGIVTGLKTNGFFIQTPEAMYDADPNTSEGIFVFTGGVPPATAVVGNNLCVTGTVGEFVPGADPNSPSQTEITSPSTFVISTGNALPASVTITAADTDPSGGIFQLEKYEGMRVTVASLTVVAPTGGNISEPNATSTSTGYFFGVITGINRPFREPGIQEPDPLPSGAPATVTRWDANPELIGVASRGLFGGTFTDVAAGAALTGVTGPLDYTRRAYTINIDLPSTTPLPLISNNNQTYTAVPAQTNDELTVASFNIERFYDNINDPGGDAVLTTTAYDNRLNKVSLAIRNVLRSPDVIGIIEVENLSVLQTIADKVNNDAVAAGEPNPIYAAYLAEGNDVGLIDVGFLVKSERVNVLNVTQYGLADTYINPNNGQPEILNDRPPLVLNGTFNKPGCNTPYPFMVIVNHLRSLNGVDDPADGNRVRTKRRAQAEFLANLIQGFQIADPSVNIISVGDFNAFQFNDGYVDMIGTIKGTPTPASDVTLASVDLVNPDLTDLVDSHTPGQRYSFVFEGNAQVLDHILVNANALNKVSRYSIARLNADFPEIYRNDATRPERISDHDAPVAYLLFTDVIPPTASCKPVTVTLVNGTATITPADIDNGSSDECGPVTLSVSKSQFDCSNIGTNNVVLTITDASGNTSACTAVVTVVGEIPSCTITAIPGNNIYTGGIPTNIYLGYGPQNVMLSINATGGAPFTYAWSGSGGLSCTDCNFPSFTSTTEGVYNFTVTVTNSYGCTATCSITICVSDIRVPGTNGKKVYLCHAPPGNPSNTKTLSVNINAVDAHLADHPEDRMGICGQDPCSAGLMVGRNKIPALRISSEKLSEPSLQVTVLPNPSSNYFNLQIKAKSDASVSLKIFNVYGKLVSQRSGISSNSIIKTKDDLLPGVYFAEVIQGKERKTVKLVKL